MMTQVNMLLEYIMLCYERACQRCPENIKDTGRLESWPVWLTIQLPTMTASQTKGPALQITLL